MHPKPAYVIREKHHMHPKPAYVIREKHHYFAARGRAVYSTADALHFDSRAHAENVIRVLSLKAFVEPV